MLIKAFDSNGCINTAELLAALRPTLNARRAAVTATAWASIDSEGTQTVTVDRLKECYDVSRNSDYIDGV